MMIGTRGSRLAMVQADMVIKAAERSLPHIGLEVKVVTTSGDRDRSTPLESMGGYGVFTKELDQRLLSGEIDLAVNSLKDMPSQLTPGTRMVAVLPRGPVEDVLVSRVLLSSLPPGSLVGTSSVRRKALIRQLRPDLQVAELRGNVTTRVNKWRKGDYQAIVLAGAGLERLGESAPRHLLDPCIWVPPAGQGAVALVCRDDDAEAGKLSVLDHAPTRICVDIERKIMLGLGASCQVPLGIWALTVQDGIELRCAWLAPDGAWIKRFEAKLPSDPEADDVEALVSVMKEKWEWTE